MDMFIAYIFNVEDGSHYDDFVIKAHTRDSAWDKALQMVFSKSLFSTKKMIILQMVDDPF